jgi:hypothetical protein
MKLHGTNKLINRIREIGWENHLEWVKKQEQERKMRATNGNI